VEKVGDNTRLSGDEKQGDWGWVVDECVRSEREVWISPNISTDYTIKNVGYIVLK
jgi:hypothetical protein